jgi:hypothetical protein
VTAPTTTTAPALPPTGAAVTNDAAGNAVAGSGAGGAAAGTSPSGGSARNTRPSPTRPGKDSEPNAETLPDTNWFDASGLSGLLGVGPGAENAAPAGDTSASAPTELASALPSRDHASGSSSAVLLGLSLLILLALAGGAAVRWWDQRPNRYWSA